MTARIKIILLLLLILILTAVSRLYGLDWDQGSGLHPDERFLTMVTADISLPDSLAGYLDTSSSPANPHNRGYGFYVYGTFPVVFVKWLAVSLNLDSYTGIMHLGRRVSALLDIGLVLLIFLITRRIFSAGRPALLGAFFYVASVLPIQLAHFYAVDTFMVFFLVLGFYFLIHLYFSRSLFLKSLLSIFLGLSFGLAVASKISALLFAPVIALGFLVYAVHTRHLPRLLLLLFAVTISGYFSLRLAQPYLFADSRLVTLRPNPKVISNWRDLNRMSTADASFPPAVQWLHVPKISYSLGNLTLWGLGLPLAIVAFFSFIPAVFHLRRHPLLILPLVWVSGLFLYQSVQFAQPIRYFYPIYPFLGIISGFGFSHFLSRFRHPGLILALTLTLALIWPISFMSIYSRPHSRVSASRWINQNVPYGSTLSCEHWDDCLPIGNTQGITIIEFPLYGQDSQAKWQDMSRRLDQTDYIILSSNRLYGSIMTAPERYPITTSYYQLLFSGALGFSKVAEFTSRPNLPFPGLHLCLTPPFIKYGSVAFSSQQCPLSGVSFVDDYADETFTVYDHPKVLIFQNTARLSPPEIFNKISSF
ncbi:hypothetical protein A3H89_00115 [Candidatus Amesbacteria bacterium RIFCSPLOWO2_02_FULL_48_11]|nr:MAG: hypothetical protein A3H89_00115 [Candidatus Amesbacteria bacterium RIFCSPLOWO2_02_FULL_48_11]